MKQLLNPLKVVAGHEKLTEIFGRWPSFHDAEIISIRFERRGRHRWEGPCAYVNIHVCEEYFADEAKSQIKWRRHTIVTFRFAPVVDLVLTGFNQQNAIWDLTFEPGAPASKDMIWSGPAYRVNFHQSFGAGLAFVCRTVEIASIERACPPDSVYA